MNKRTISKRKEYAIAFGLIAFVVTTSLIIFPYFDRLFEFESGSFFKWTTFTLLALIVILSIHRRFFGKDDDGTGEKN